MAMNPAYTNGSRRRLPGKGVAGLCSFTALGLIFFAAFIIMTAMIHSQRSGKALTLFGKGNEHGPVLVSYSFFQKDPVQKKDFEFFIKVGMGIQSTYKAPPQTHFSIVINGDICEPCSALYPYIKEVPVPDPMTWLKFAKAGSYGPTLITFLWRNENEGMDFAAHNATLEWYLHKKAIRKYKFFIFLNSSVRGPFYPSYMPDDWFWTRSYTDYLRRDVKAVSSSVVCLPHVDAGGFGAKLESWAFALDMVGLQLLMRAGTFSIRTCKLCTDGVVVQGEYGITLVLFKNGYNVATLMHKYDKFTDWRESKNWRCNNNAHPSRHGTYDGISMHPFEVVFLKASWHVGHPHLNHYTDWNMDKAEGKLTTRGYFDEAMYRWAITLEAQDEPIMHPCFNVLAYDVRDNTPIDRRAGYDNPVIAAAQRALPEAKKKDEVVEEEEEEKKKDEGPEPLEPMDEATFGKSILDREASSGDDEDDAGDSRKSRKGSKKGKKASSRKSKRGKKKTKKKAVDEEEEEAGEEEEEATGDEE